MFAIDPPKGEDYYNKQILPVLQDYCYDCHGDGMDKGEFALDAVTDFKELMKDKQMWDNVREHMESYVMPPENKSQPSREERERVTHWIENDVFWVDPAKPDPGHITLRRLNRTEYNNTVRDIFRTGLRPANVFPPDDSGYGFDNIGDVLSLSPLLMEKYMKAAKKITENVVWIKEAERKGAETQQKLWKIDQGAGAINGNHSTLWSNGSMEIPFRVHRNGLYRLVLNLSSNPAGPEGAQYRVLLNGKEVHAGEVKSAYKEDRPDANWQRVALDVKLNAGRSNVVVEFLNDFNDANNPDPSRRDRNLLIQTVELKGPTGYLYQDLSPFLSWLLDGKRLVEPAIAFGGEEFDVVKGLVIPADRAIFATNGVLRRKIEVPAAGDYTLKLRVGQDKAGNEPAKFKGKFAGKDLGIHAADVAPGKFKEIALPFQLTAGSHEIEIEFINDAEVDGKDRNFVLDRVVLENKQLQRINYKDEAFIKQWVNRLGLKMFRRKLTPEDEAKLVAMAKMVYESGDGFEESVKLVSEALLCSSRFLFRGGAEPAGPVVNGSALVDEFTLATRLSYFLWSTTPDDELLALAGRNELRKNLRPQIERMLKDARSFTLAENFAGQWLQLRDMDLVEPVIRLFPEIAGGTRDLYKRETQMYFNHILKNNRTVLEFLDSNYTFLNEKLAGIYGIQGVKGNQFREVSLEGTPRGGVLTHGSILTLTSHPNRTSPVKRGTFLLENVLGTPPPPAPQNVPPLSEDRGAKIQGTLRQRFEAHRSNPSCAGCHAFLDPMGFAFENYNAIGLWRGNDNGEPIDSTGKLLTGETFKDAQELRKLLVKVRGKEFVRNLVRNLLTFSMGRGLEYSDRMFVKEISEAASKEGYRFQDLLFLVAESTPFQKMRVGDPPKSAGVEKVECPEAEVAAVKTK